MLLPTPPLVESPIGRMLAAILSISASFGPSGPASKANRTTTIAPVPTVEGKASDWTYPPGPTPVVTRQRTR